MTAKSSLLWRMDRLFPPDPTAYLDSAQQTEHEWRKASKTLGTYLSVDAGFAIDRFLRIPVCNQRRLAALPIVGDLLTFGIDLRLRKPARS